MGVTRFSYRLAPTSRWPHQFGFLGHKTFSDTMKRCAAVEDWCGEFIGRRWMHVNGMFYLQEESDALAFRLRWC